ncbi:hypothetical protein [Palleronia sp.]|uniref:hypothetical protein n=1 Tax=Palleronia sp. TaxID=1940284 RepID=UPI0035C7EAB2
MPLPTATVTGTFSFADGKHLDDARVIFQLAGSGTDVKGLDHAERGIIVTEPIEVTAQFDRFEVELWPNARGTAPTHYAVTLQYTRSGKQLAQSLGAITVPENGGDLTDLLVVGANTKVVGSIVSLLSQDDYNAAILAQSDAQAVLTETKSIQEDINTKLPASINGVLADTESPQTQKNKIISRVDNDLRMSDGEPDLKVKTAAALLGLTVAKVSVGDVIEVSDDGNRYERVEDDALEWDETTSDGMRLRALHLSKRVQVVRDRASLKLLNRRIGLVYLSEGGRSGHFRWDASISVYHHQQDKHEGIYVAPESTAAGAWVRQWHGPAASEWFGGRADYTSTTDQTTGIVTGAGTNNADAINSCLTICGNCLLGQGRYGVSSPVNLGQGQNLFTLGIGMAYVEALPGFAGTAVVRMAATRTTVEKLIVNVANGVFDPKTYDPATHAGPVVDCFETSDFYFHQYLTACRATGGRRGFSIGSLESKIWGCHAQGNYDGFYVIGFDTTVLNISATDNERYGVYTEKGLQGCDIHVVRAKDTCLYLFNQVPVNVSTIHIDTPKYRGIVLHQTKGATLDGVFFTKAGEFRVNPADHDVRYFQFINSRGNYIKGGAIQIQNNAEDIDRTGHYFVHFGDSADDSLRSTDNRFENFHTHDIVITANAGQRRAMQAQKSWGNHGSIARYNNEAMLYKSEELTLAAGASMTAKMWMPETDLGAGDKMITLMGSWNARASMADRSAGTFLIPVLPNSDTGVKDGAIHTLLSAGAAPTISITDVSHNETTRVLNFTYKNTSAFAIKTGFSVSQPTDNQGPD